MVLVIKNKVSDEAIVKNYNLYFIEKVCELKNIESEDNTILLLDIEIDEAGVIKDYNFFLEEVVITIPVKTVITNFENEKVKEICEFHQINLITI